MSPFALRAIFSSCLALGLADLAWLDVNALRLNSDESWERLQAPLPIVSAELAKPVVATTLASPPASKAPAARSTGSASQSAAVTSWTIQFDRSFSVIRSDQAPNLAAIADAARSDVRAIVQIGGHADRLAWKGNRGSNLALSDNRAVTVARALLKLGVPSDRIRHVAFGDTRPIDERTTEEAYRRNRRVEVRIELGGGR
jgi:outer membrane protein OmpA-like peptidoglycan-associated protein